MMNLIFRIFFLLILLLYLSCDTDRYLGFDIEAQDLADTAIIAGNVINFYDGMPVYKAKVKIGILETLTDKNGNYQIPYILSDDENRNKPVSILISKENYFQFEDSTFIVPSAMSLNFSLRYAAPIIMAIARRTHPINQFQVVCQAKIRDYQGITNIDSVIAVLSYLDESDKVNLYKSEMEFKGAISNIEAYYQTTVEVSNLTPYLWVLVNDNDSYSDSLFHSTRPAVPDVFLFDPNL